MPSPRLDALEVTVAEITRPPGQLRKLTGKFDDMLARAAADLDGVSGFSGQISFQDTEDGLMVTVKRRRIEPSIGVTTAIILAKFNDIAGHLGSPGFRCTAALSGDGLYALTIIFGSLVCGNCLLSDCRSFKFLMMMALTIAATSPLGVARAQSNAAEGQKLAFDRAKGNCLSCHEIKGGDLTGTIGPALKDIQRKYPDRNDLAAILTDETLRNPLTAMPPFGRNRILTEQEIDAIVDFL